MQKDTIRILNGNLIVINIDGLLAVFTLNTETLSFSKLSSIEWFFSSYDGTKHTSLIRDNYYISCGDVEWNNKYFHRARIIKIKKMILNERFSFSDALLGFDELKNVGQISNLNDIKHESVSLALDNIVYHINKRKDKNDFYKLLFDDKHELKKNLLYLESLYQITKMT